MRVWEYESYEDYLEFQNNLTKKKNTWVYAQERTIKKICDRKGFNVKNILCHGTRAAGEQRLFNKFYPGAYIIGSEICDTAENFPMTIRHDFNKQRSEWIAKFDIVYSNSFDHSITPAETLQTWRDQLNPSGTLFLEYAERQSRHNAEDPLDATALEIENLISDNGMVVVDKIDQDVKHGGVVFVCEVSEK